MMLTGSVYKHMFLSVQPVFSFLIQQNTFHNSLETHLSRDFVESFYVHFQPGLLLLCQARTPLLFLLFSEYVKSF